MSGWKWAGRASAFAVGCVLVGGGAGIGLGEANSPAVIGVTATLGFLVGGAIAVNLVGAAGMWAVVLGLITAMSVGTQWQRWSFVRSVTFTEATESWPAVGRAVHFAQPLLHANGWEGKDTVQAPSGKNGSVQVTLTAVPLVARKGGPVLAFDCYSSRAGDREGPDGAWVVLSSFEPLGPSGGCEGAIAKAKERLDAAGQLLAPGADARVVTLYGTYEQFSQTNLSGALGVSGVLLLLYVLGVVLYREKGAAGAP